jgi:hypothetical protein
LRDNYKEKQRLLSIQAEIDAEEYKAMEELTPEGRAYLYHRLPIEAMETAILSLANVSDVIRDFEEKDKKKDKSIQDEISNPDITYLGSMALLATIKQQRMDVETQKATIQQIQSNMATMYARLQMMEIEQQASAQNQNTEELKKIVIGHSYSKEERLSWQANR